jgi:hypothetical protein
MDVLDFLLCNIFLPWTPLSEDEFRTEVKEAVRKCVTRKVGMFERFGKFFEFVRNVMAYVVLIGVTVLELFLDATGRKIYFG